MTIKGCFDDYLRNLKEALAALDGDLYR